MSDSCNVISLVDVVIDNSPDRVEKRFVRTFCDGSGIIAVTGKIGSKNVRIWFKLFQMFSDKVPDPSFSEVLDHPRLFRI